MESDTNAINFSVSSSLTSSTFSSDSNCSFSSSCVNYSSSASSENPVLYKLDSYGKGDYRLLSYLPDGTAAWEMPMGKLSDEQNALKQYAESYCVAMDMLEKASEENRNEEAWRQAKEERDKSEVWLSTAAATFDMLLGTLNANKGEKYLKLIVCQKKKSENDEFYALKKAFISRQNAIIPLVRHLQTAREELSIQKSIKEEKEFLVILNYMRQNFKVNKRKYTNVDYDQIDVNYPYASEVVVEYFSLPSQIWNLSNKSMTNIFHSCMPQHFISPFVSQFAHLVFKRNIVNECKHDHGTKNCWCFSQKRTNEDDFKCDRNSENNSSSKQHDNNNDNNNNSSAFFTLFSSYNSDAVNENDLEHSGKCECCGARKTLMLIKFESFAAHFIELLYCLSIKINPINIYVFKWNNATIKDDKNVSGSYFSGVATKARNKLDGKLSEEERIFKKLTFAPLNIPSNILNFASREVYKKLRIAQWILLDKAIFCIISSHAHMFKNDFDEIINDSFNKSIEEFLKKNEEETKSLEGKDNNSFFFNSFSNENNRRKTNCTSKDLQILCVKSDEEQLCFLIKNLPLKMKNICITNKNVNNKNSNENVDENNLNSNECSNLNFYPEEKREKKDQSFESIAFIDVNLCIHFSSITNKNEKKIQPKKRKIEKQEVCSLQHVLSSSNKNESAHEKISKNCDYNSASQPNYFPPLNSLSACSNIIKLVEKLLLCSLRDICLSIWKMHVYETPKYFPHFNFLDASEFFKKTSLLISFIKNALRIICHNLLLYVFS